MRSIGLGIVGSGLLLCVAACGDDSSGSAEPAGSGGSEATGGSATTGGSAATGGSSANGGSATAGTGGDDDASGGTPAGSQGGSSAGGSISAENPEEYFLHFAELFCSGLASCCTDAGFGFSEPYCRDLFSTAAASFQGLSYDRAAGERCLADLQGRLGDCMGEGVPLCEGVFMGAVELGGVCNQDADCVPSDLGDVGCDIVGSGLTEQICVVSIRSEEGDPCVETCFDGPGIRSCLNAVPGADDGNPERGQCFLNDGLWCESSTLECMPALEPGETCGSSYQCGAYAICDGVCVDGAADGETCADFTECEEGLLCNPDEDVCELAPADSLEGACTTFGTQ